MRVSGGKAVTRAVTVTVAVTGCAVAANGRGPSTKCFNVGLAERYAPILLDAESNVVFVSAEMLLVAPVAPIAVMTVSLVAQVRT